MILAKYWLWKCSIGGLERTLSTQNVDMKQSLWHSAMWQIDSWKHNGKVHFLDLTHHNEKNDFACSFLFSSSFKIWRTPLASLDIMYLIQY